MRAKSVSSTSELVHLQSVDELPPAKTTSSSSTEEVSGDSFEESTTAKKVPHKYSHIIRAAKALRGIPLEDLEGTVDTVSKERAIAREMKFIGAPTVKGFLRIAKSFENSMSIVGHARYRYLDDFAVKGRSSALDALNIVDVSGKEQKLEYWHQKQELKNRYERDKEELKSQQRHDKIEAHGKGFGGKMTTRVANAKEKSFYAKNNFTIRGNVFKLTHTICPRNLYEIMPRFGYRKGAHIGVRVSQFTITTFLAGLGYGLAPVTFGVSKIATDHARSIVTLSGEVITHKIAGADNKKCMVHASLRGVQLEIPRLIPFAGDVVNIGENIAFGSAAAGVVSTTVADMLLSHYCGRYTSTLNLDDLGDSRCIAELNSRIDYLSQFLLPHGQYLLLKETDMAERSKLKTALKQNFAVLRDLEKKKINSLNFYRLALAAEKLPLSVREKIRTDCEAALPETRINTHRVVKKCLAALMANDLEAVMLAHKQAA